MVNAKTFSQKSADIDRKWYLVDASTAPLGRVSTQIANLLIGKSKVTYTPHIDNGDYVVVINAGKVIVTGDKETGKIYYRHSGFPGGISDATLKQVREKDPARIIKESVKGMIPRNKLSEPRLNRLKIFVGEEHTHTAQTPQKVEMK